MTAITQKRVRILRLRTIEHKIATAKLSQANLDLSKMVSIQERIENLQVNTHIKLGAHSGPELRATGEMQQRLSDAYDALAHSKIEAEEHKQETEQLRKVAHQHEESAAQLHDHSQQSDVQESIRRQDANVPNFRKFLRIG